MKQLIFCVLLVVCALGAQAKEAAPLARDPALEARMLTLSKELRCLVCQNETLADSQADLAKDLREEVREKMQQGMSDAQIKAYLTQRYGDFVLYKPPVKSITWLLWFGPFVLLAGGAVALVLFLRKQTRAVNDAPLDAAETSRVCTLLQSESEQP